ncbi:MAG: DUF4340 domain-containing protein [Halioglobus sp.]|nr:DUF4340 domain-containing protein [Halioglobus sp.]
MKHWIPALIVVLVIQCAIVATVFWPQPASRQQDARQAFAAFPIDAIDELHIGDEFDNEVVLVRSGEQWLLPDLEDLPADASRVDALLKSLTTQSGSWPVADSPAARQRFQVADYYYQKRLSLLSGGQPLGTIYFGTSPGFRKVHARNDRQDAIYSIAFDTVAFPAVSGAWLDRNLLQIRAPLQIDSDLYNLRFENGNWLLATGGQPDEQALATLITTLKNLQVDGIASEDLQRELSAAEADLVLTVQGLAGEVTLKFVTLKDRHFIHSSEFPLFFECSTSDYARLVGIDAGLISGDDGNR